MKYVLIMHFEKILLCFGFWGFFSPSNLNIDLKLSPSLNILVISTTIYS